MKVREPQWLLAGGLVPKFQTPAGKLPKEISNIRLDRDDFWNTYNQDVINRWSQLASDLSKSITDINDFIRRHYNIYKATKYTDTGKAIKNDLVKQYQEDYHNDYGFGNSDSFWNGFERLGTGEGTADKRNVEGTDFTGDNYYGGQTHRRRSTFFNADELALANEAVKSRGWQFVEDTNMQYGDDPTRKSYVLQEIPSSQSNGDDVSATDSNLPATTTTQTTKQQNTPTKIDFGDNKKPKKSKLNWSDWVPLTMQLANDLVANDYISKLKKKMRFPLKEGPYLQHKITNDYYARTQLEQAAQDARSAASMQNLTSDIDQNLRIRDAAEKRAGQYLTQAGQMKSQKFAEETRLAEDVANKNKITGAEVANYNRQQNAAAWNNILIANQEKAAKDLQSTNSYIGNMYQSLGEALKTKRLNDANYQKQYNQAWANTLINNARKEYDTNYNDFTKWSDVGSMFDAALESNEISTCINGHCFLKNWQDQQKYGLTQELRDALNNWLLNGKSDQAARWRTNWSTYRQKLQNDYYDKVRNINSELESRNNELPLFVDNQWHLDELSGQKRSRRSRTSPIHTTTYHKSGGRLGSRLSDFTYQYSKELQHVRRSSDRRNETSLKHLDKQLERLNREQIILLRSAFK